MKKQDVFAFLKCLTPAKVMNALKVWASYQWGKLTRKPVQWGMPFTMSVEPTTSCNLGCPECPSGLKQFTRPTGHLQMERYQTLLDEMASKLMYLYFYFQGEPYINPKFLDMVRMASERGIYTVTSTNAHYLSPRRARETVQSGLSRILISLDGVTQEVYEQYRKGGTMNKVIEGTKNLIEAKRELGKTNPHIVLQFLVVGPNEHQIPDVLALGKELGVDEVKLKTAQIYDYENGSPLIPKQEQYARYKKLANGKYVLKNPLHNNCWKLWHSCVMTWDGRIVPCCFDKDASYEMGVVGEQRMEDIWFGKPYHAFRSRLLKGRKEIDICKNCTEGLKVWVD